MSRELSILNNSASIKTTRRDFLYIATAAVGAVGAAATLVPLIDQINPDASTLAAGGPTDLNLSKVQPGQQVVVRWRQRPIYVVRRTPQILHTLRDPKLLAELADPQSSERQQPPYADNWHRSIKPEYSVLVGIFTISVAYPYLNRCRMRHTSRELVGRLFLSVSRLKIRSGRPRVSRRSCSLQFAGSAILFLK